VTGDLNIEEDLSFDMDAICFAIYRSQSNGLDPLFFHIIIIGYQPYLRAQLIKQSTGEETTRMIFSRGHLQLTKEL
jgi:hypothetical protein